MDPITGMPLNVVSPLPPGAKSSSPMDVASANIAASNAKMSSLINATHGGSKHNRKHYRKHNTLKGGASSLVVQPLHVPYPGGDALQGINTQMTSISAQNVANSKYDNDWNKTGGKRSYKRTNKRRSSNRSNKRTNKRRRTNKRSSKRYKKM
jgi:hypothetical protein